MRKIIAIITVVLISIVTITIPAFANTGEEARRRRTVSAAAASESTTISFKVFRKIEEILRSKGIKRKGLWEASTIGFTSRVNENALCEHLLLTWDGKLYGVILHAPAFGGNEHILFEEF